GSAFGPWQIINAAAKDIRRFSGVPFHIIDIRNRVWDPRDDRGFLLQSTYMAAIYLKSICDKFNQDQALCPIAYHMGPNGAVGTLEATAQKINSEDSLDRLTKYQVTFDMVAQYRMAPQDKIDYGMKFLAL